MDFDSLIAMDIERAEAQLAKSGVPFQTVQIKTFKLLSDDCIKVVKYSVDKDIVTLYCAKFKRGVDT